MLNPRIKSHGEKSTCKVASLLHGEEEIPTYEHVVVEYEGANKMTYELYIRGSSGKVACAMMFILSTL